jgi:hypothetical protein
METGTTLPEEITLKEFICKKRSIITRRLKRDKHA